MRRLGKRKPRAKVDGERSGNNAPDNEPKPRANPFEKYRGALGRFPGGVKGINAWIRDLRGGDFDRES